MKKTTEGLWRVAREYSSSSGGAAWGSNFRQPPIRNPAGRGSFHRPRSARSSGKTPQRRAD